HVLDVLRTLYQATGLRQASAPWVLFYIWLAIGFVNAVLLVAAACRGPAIHAAERDFCLPSYANATITVCSSTPAYETSDAYALAADDAPHAAAGSMDIFCHARSSDAYTSYSDGSSSVTAAYSNYTAIGSDTDMRYSDSTGNNTTDSTGDNATDYTASSQKVPDTGACNAAKDELDSDEDVPLYILASRLRARGYHKRMAGRA
ncbi:hypothetical protein H4R18_005881, partial [Coemansia javaensis]